MNTRILLMSGSVLLLAACGGGGGGNTPPQTPPVVQPPANMAPTAQNQSLTLDEDSSLDIVLAGVDSDGSITSYQVVSPFSNGAITGDLPNIRYVPNANFNGEDSLTFTVTDDDDAVSEVATITITVQSVNDVPTAQTLALSVDEDESVSFDLSANDIDGQIVEYRIVNATENGVVSGSSANFTYVPIENYSGDDQFDFVAIDNEGGQSALTTVTIEVEAVNDSPVLSAIENPVIEENTLSTGVIPADYASDVEDEELTITLANSGDSALFEVDENTGVLQFIESPDFEVPLDDNSDNFYTVELTVTDTDGAAVSEQISVQVEDVSVIELNMVYPTINANLGGHKTSTLVSGTATDIEDGEVLASDLQVVEVNGEQVVLVGDRSKWDATIDVSQGEQTIDVQGTTGSDTIASQSFSIQNTLLPKTLESPLGGVVDEANNRLIAVDASLNAVVAINIITGQVTELSGPSVGTGIAFEIPRSIAFDDTRGLLYVVDTALDGIIRVDLSDGSRALVIENNFDNSEADLAPRDITYDAASDTLYLTANADVVLEKINPETLARTVVTGAGIGAGDSISSIDSVAIDNTNNVAYVTQRSQEKLFQVDLTTGDRTLLVEGSSLLTNGFSDIINIAVSSNGSVVYFVGRTNEVDPVSAVYSYIVASDSVLIIQQDTTDGDDAFGFAQDIVLHSSELLYWVLDSVRENVFTVTVTTNTKTRLVPTDETANLNEPKSALWDDARDRWYVYDRDVVYVAQQNDSGISLAPFSSDSVGDGYILSDVRAITFDAASDRLFVVDRPSSTQTVIVEIDVENGGRRLVLDSDVIGSNFYTYDLVFDGENETLYFTDFRFDEIVKYVLTEPRPEAVSNNSVGTGTALLYGTVTVGDLEDDRLFVYDNGLKSVLAVDIATGNRTVIASSTVGAGPDLDSIWSMVLDKPNNRLIAVMSEFNLVIGISLTTGERSLLSRADAELPLFGSDGMSYDADKNLLYIADFVKESIYVIELSQGQRAILTR